MDRINGYRTCYLCEKTVAIIDLTEDDKLVCEHCGAERRVKDYLPAVGAIYEGPPQVAATANSTLQGSADINSSSPTMAMSDDTEFKPSFLRGLPKTFYLVACLTFFAYVFVWADSHNNYLPGDIDGESGWLVVEGLLTAIAFFAGGRTIELLQNIDDELYRKRLSESP